MSIFLGSSGLVRLERTSANKVRTNIAPGDINTTKKRFTLDLPDRTLQTGDKLYIRRIDAFGTPSSSDLTFIDASAWPGGSQQSNGNWYINVDSLNGIRLYSTWAKALRGADADALSLASIAAGYPLVVNVDDIYDHVLGGVQSYELSTNRAAVDVTSLGDAFVQQHEGLISGQGSVQCLWDFQTGDNDSEFAQYAHNLILRQKIGGRFRAAFYLKQAEDTGAYGSMDADDISAELFYGVTAVITNVAISFQPGEPVRSQIDFVTTGELELLYELPAGYLLTQSANTLVTQQGNALALSL